MQKAIKCNKENKEKEAFIPKKIKTKINKNKQQKSCKK